MKHHYLTIALISACLTSPMAMADAKKDADMLKLASTSGCMTCHGIEAGKPGPDGMKPIGPAWVEVAKQYKGKPGASEFLTRVVLEGSNPYSSHWKGKVSGLSMPPNAVAITEGNARLLVNWILAL
ncbi:c-type cytochrome [Dechloromonas sp. H13]|uniref:c-type cytochrome n=1 Tax=Dechloromonas sp. H13 TaxID=2570193 RepID=UPI00129131C0|nr:c-type cytochrome [Dechloromonas sp. H13]